MPSPNIVAVGPVTAMVLPWRRGARLWATVICKATFAFPDPDANGALVSAPAVDIFREERHHRGHPGRSIREAVDAVPLKARADVVFTGSAHSTGGPVTECRPRIRVTRGGHPILDKGLRVFGDRAHEGADPAPFSEMALVYERAKGGIGAADNPLGAAVPNVVHARAAAGPAGFAPISQTWATRKKLIFGNRKPLDQEVAEVEMGIDAYFQCAPADQQTDKWIGDEVVLLEHLDRLHPSRTLALPRVRALALIETPDQARREVALECDTIFIDGDAARCSLTWRAAIAFDDRASLWGSVFAAAIDIGAQGVTWPDLDALDPPATVRIDVPAARVGGGGTLVMEEAPPPETSVTPIGSEAAPPAMTLPFKGAMPRADHDEPAAPASIPGAPWARTKADPIGDVKSSRTVELHLDAIASLEPEPAPPPPPPSVAVAASRPAPPRATATATAWRKPDPEPTVVAPPPGPPLTYAARARASRPAVKQSLYGGKAKK